MPSLQQALDLHRAGKLPEAERAYRAVLQSQPRQPDALSLLGVVLDAQGKAAEAVEFIRKAVALDPKAALFRLHLGNALLTAGQPADAAVELRAATRMQPNLAEAHYNLGNALWICADHVGAAVALRACLTLMPDYQPARNNLALVLAAQGEHAAAMTEMRQVVLAEPNNLSAQINLANIADAAGEYQLALREAEKAVALQPQYPGALFAQGLALNRLQRDAEAVAVYRRLLALAPEHHRAWDNLGQSLQALGDIPAATTAYRQALTLAPDDAETNYHWALLLLLRGDLVAGFRAYDWRWQAVTGLRRLPLAVPVWDGSDPVGKTILVADEQGFGDSLMFCRYLPLLRQRGARVIYACSPALLPLVQGWGGADQIVPVTEATKIVCDAHCSLLDLPHWLGTTVQNIPATVPYLAAPEGDVPASIFLERDLRVGLVWAGNPKHKHDGRRSIAFDRFVALAGVSGVRYYNLMRSGDLRDNEAVRFAAYDIIDLGAQIGDFAASARFVAAMDLVIAVDTAAVHLAGALGQNIWTLLPFAPDWRWQLGRDDSPWYPSATLYRQEQPGDWATVLARVRKDLAVLAEKKAKQNAVG